MKFFNKNPSNVRSDRSPRVSIPRVSMPLSMRAHVRAPYVRDRACSRRTTNRGEGMRKYFTYYRASFKPIWHSRARASGPSSKPRPVATNRRDRFCARARISPRERGISARIGIARGQRVDTAIAATFIRDSRLRVPFFPTRTTARYTRISRVSHRK